ncbi:phosphohydrolase [Bacillus sp. M6-12]|uniref:MSMEG_1061 family FMN-dependent PPOX-type flavoprotein n=1 Tax=Bacillus sp. M6-12 TaxID=2054166 RepID=UPI000C778E4B|nr:MSMEG_1061 family FMN-dependent PPOX-type flavoprotein [Bacillus sp. M6-12]PLS18156.1 phosphohydrolase [Bacillus sp. M6-12]
MVFLNIVSSEDELREMLGFPGKLAANKVIDHLDVHCAEFLKKTPYIVISTCNDDGQCDASPRGDSPGFIHIVNSKQFVIPERPGNRRLDSILNILKNPGIGLLCMIPGLDETLRINGKASLIKDPDIMAQMAVGHSVPSMGIAVTVEECFIHCAKALKRSRLWNIDSWAKKDELPHPATIITAHTKLENLTVSEVAACLEESYTKRLY